MIKKEDKSGWIRIVEAFVAVLLITGVVLIFINKGYFGDKNDVSEKIYSVENSILAEIQTDEDLRGEILIIDSVSGVNLPVNSDQEFFPTNVKIKIENRLPEYLLCNYAICRMDEICSQPDSTPNDKNIYAQSVGITANTDVFSPRQLKMFCWTK